MFHRANLVNKTQILSDFLEENVRKETFFVSLGVHICWLPRNFAM